MLSLVSLRTCDGPGWSPNGPRVQAWTPGLEGNCQLASNINQPKPPTGDHQISHFMWPVRAAVNLYSAFILHSYTVDWESTFFNYFLLSLKNQKLLFRFNEKPQINTQKLSFTFTIKYIYMYFFLGLSFCKDQCTITFGVHPS